MSGIMIAIDGVDGGGKTELLKWLSFKLFGMGYKAERVKCPYDKGLSGTLRRLVLGQQIAGIETIETDGGARPLQTSLKMAELPSPLAGRVLFLAEWLHTYETIVKPALECNDIVLLDRSHFLSNMAYALEPGMSEGERQKAEFAAAMILEIQIRCTRNPQLAVVLDVPYEVACQRLADRAADNGETNHFDSAAKELFEMRRNRYHQLAQIWEYWVRLVDASGTREETQERTWEHIMQCLEKNNIVGGTNEGS